MATRFMDKIVLVTGAGSGIGAAVARAFAREGACLALADLNEDGLAATARDVEKLGGQAILCPGDVTIAADVSALVARVVREFGGLDHAVNAAGVSHAPKLLADFTEAEFDRVLAINTRAVWLCMKYEIEAMLARGGGAIVNIASGAGIVTVPHMGPYVTSKHAVMGLTKAGAVDYAKHNIRINCLCPGFTRTPMALGAIRDMGGVTEEDIAAALPIGRIAEPEEQADAVLYLCSDDSRYMVGHALVVDGGHSIV